MKNRIKILEEENKESKIRVKNMQDILYTELELKSKFESECG